METDRSPEALGLCPHGRLPGICKECLQTEEGQELSAEI